MKRVLTALVQLYPAPFREQFAAQVVHDIEREWSAARAAGLPALCWFFASAAWDLAASAIAERLSPTWRAPFTPSIEKKPTVYYAMVGPTPRAWRLTSPGYAVKTPRAEIVANEIRALVKEVAPEAPMYRAFTMDFLTRRNTLQLRFTMMTLGIVSALALILGAVGLYGVLSYIVAERTREIGVRMALGAEAGQVRRMVVGQGARVVAVGVGIGLAVSYWSTKALGTLLFGVTALDAATFVGMSAGMLGVGMLASYMPARRASAVDPVESLRGD